METTGQRIAWTMSFLPVSILMFGQQVLQIPQSSRHSEYRGLRRPPRSPRHYSRLKVIQNILDCDGSRVTAAPAQLSPFFFGVFSIQATRGEGSWKLQPGLWWFGFVSQSVLVPTIGSFSVFATLTNHGVVHVHTTHV